MTLIATFEINKTPVLIGDLMLSQDGSNKEHSKLPTYDDVSVLLPIEWGKIVAGLHRKVCIIHPKIVVAWAGDLQYAAFFMESLLNFFYGRHKDSVDKKSLKDALLHCESLLSDFAYPSIIGKDDLIIIGWIITKEKKAHQFEWRWNFINYFKEKTNVIRGSGSEDLKEVINNRINNNHEGQISRAPVAAEIVNLISILIGTEVSTGKNIPHLYGGGYDIILLSDGIFKYLSDVLYIPIFIYDLEKVNIRIDTPWIFFKYYYVNGHLVIVRKILKRERGVVTHDEITTSVIGRFGVSGEDLKKIKVENQYVFESSIISMIFLSQLKNGDKVHAPLVVPKDNKFLKFQNQSIGLNLKEINKTVFLPLKEHIVSQQVNY